MASKLYNYGCVIYKLLLPYYICIFGYNKRESVNARLLELGRLNVKHLIMLRKVKFYRNLLHSCNTVLSDVFFMFLLNNFSNNCVLQTIFMSKSDATRSVWCAFENYVVL